MRAVFDRSVFARERQALCDSQFEECMRILEQREYRSIQEAEEAVNNLYFEWAEKFEIVKAEFNSVWDLFHGVETRVAGWYCVSPNLAPWRSVALTKFGYTFAACIMKNHHRDAPLSEKSLSVSFGLDEAPIGIGDERLIGYKGVPTDTLVGLSQCQPKSLKEQGEGMRDMFRRLEPKQLVFRLNHRSIGQQTTKLPLSILEEYSLRELCQGLFLMLNNDVVSSLKTALGNTERLLLAVDESNREFNDDRTTDIQEKEAIDTELLCDADDDCTIIDTAEAPDFINQPEPNSEQVLVSGQKKPDHTTRAESDSQIIEIESPSSQSL